MYQVALSQTLLRMTVGMLIFGFYCSPLSLNEADIIQVNTNYHFPGSDERQRRVEEVVESALGHFGNRITRVEVHLTDENCTQKSGKSDKWCMMEARPPGRQPIAVSAEGSNWDQALDGAAGKS